MFRNGVLFGSYPRVTPRFGAPAEFRLGSDSSGNFNTGGALYSFAAYRAALSDSEIAQLYIADRAAQTAAVQALLPALS